jgi:hypothetical protein
MRPHAANVLIVIGKRDLASVAKQLIDGVDRAADDALDRADRGAFALASLPKALPHNPFRPGAGTKPEYLAGRTREKEEFERALRQGPLSQNLIITGLRGVGKTVLLDELKPLA